MATGDVVKLGGLYVSGTLTAVPQKPWQADAIPTGAQSKGDIPYYSSGQSVEIRDTPSDDTYKIRWVEINEDEKKYLISDRALLSAISWNDLQSLGIVTGKEVTIDGKKYLLRLLAGGANYRTGTDAYLGGLLPNEWDRWIGNEIGMAGLPTPTETDVDTAMSSTDLNGVHNRKWNWYGINSWCQESVVNQPNLAVSRGANSSKKWTSTTNSSRLASLGWRPVLEVLNAEPTVTISSPTANRTLYENDELQIMGSASEADIGDSVTIRYQINANTVRAIKAFVSTGTVEAFSKTLTFRGSSLYDGETLIASGLVDGVAHTLKVYATDDKGGQSPIIERTFYVVPNRAPSLTVNPPVIDGLIDSDTFTIEGSFADADGNQATVSYRINGGNSVQVAQGISGNFDFNVKFGQLSVSTNAIVVEATDSYGAKTSKTVRLTKSENVTQINRSVARYKVEPPKGEAQEMLVWIQHDAELTLDVSTSMTIDGEAETFVPMTEGTQVTLESGLIESEFYIDAGSAKENIVLQIDMTKTSADADEAITLITGVF